MQNWYAWWDRLCQNCTFQNIAFAGILIIIFFLKELKSFSRAKFFLWVPSSFWTGCDLPNGHLESGLVHLRVLETCWQHFSSLSYICYILLRSQDFSWKGSSSFAFFHFHSYFCLATDLFKFSWELTYVSFTYEAKGKGNWKKKLFLSFFYSK